MVTLKCDGIPQNPTIKWGLDLALAKFEWRIVTCLAILNLSRAQKFTKYPSHEELFVFFHHRCWKSTIQTGLKPHPEAAQVVQDQLLLVVELRILLGQGLHGGRGRAVVMNSVKYMTHHITILLMEKILHHLDLWCPKCCFYIMFLYLYFPHYDNM